MMSGYFTYCQNNINDVIRKRIAKLLKVLCWGFLVYFFISVLKEGFSTLEGLHRLLTPGTLLCNALPYAEHLWYISAYIYVLVAMLFVEKYNLYKPLFITTPILLVAAVAFGTYCEIFFKYMFPFYCSRNFLFTGLPFFALGMMAKKLKQIPSIPFLTISSIIIYVLGLMELSQFEVYLGDCFFSTSFLSVSIFLIFVNIRQPKDTIFSKIGREYGLYIYVLHISIAKIISEYRIGNMDISYISTLLVLCLTLLLISFLKKTKVIGKII